MRDNFERKLDKLDDNLSAMGQLICKQIMDSVEALMTKDVDLAKSVIKGDLEINDLEKRIEEYALKIILREQPVASDLRLVSSALKMITDMERIGDQAADIADLTIFLVKADFHRRDLGSIQAMAKECVNMVNLSVSAFVTGDLSLIEDVAKSEEKVDGYFMQVRDELIKDIREQTVDPAVLIDFLMIAKYFERIGDHAENIAEWVNYSITGETITLS